MMRGEKEIRDAIAEVERQVERAVRPSKIWTTLAYSVNAALLWTLGETEHPMLGHQPPAADNARPGWYRNDKEIVSVEYFGAGSIRFRYADSDEQVFRIAERVPGLEPPAAEKSGLEWMDASEGGIENLCQAESLAKDGSYNVGPTVDGWFCVALMRTGGTTVRTYLGKFTSEQTAKDAADEYERSGA